VDVHHGDEAEDLARVSLRLSFSLTLMNWCLPEPFIAQVWVVTTSPKA
jgi:hypothetical protein